MSLTPRSRLKLAAFAKKAQYDPLLFAEVVWPWGVPGTPLEHEDIRIWQSEVLDEISKHLTNPETRYDVFRVAVASGHGIGKALALTDEIETPVGKRVWGDLKVGDHLFGVDGAPTKVLAIPYRGTRPFYRVTFDDGSYCDVGQEHLWSVRGRQERRRGCDTWRTMETQEIVTQGVKRANGRVMARQWQIPRQGPAQFVYRPTPFDPYAIGAWLGDGDSAAARITSPDEGVREACGGSHAKGITFTVPGLHEALRDLGMLGGSCDRKRVPGILLRNDTDTRRAVLAGLMDTDADCCAGHSSEFTSTSQGLCEDVLWLARSLGMKARISGEKPSTYRDGEGTKVVCKPHWRVRVTGDVNPFRHCAHKREKWRAPTEERYLTRWVESIEPVGDRECLCVTVANPDGLYLARDFIATHNSAAMGMLSTWAMSCYDRPRILITANTEGQLRTKTSPEITEWFKSSVYRELFDYDTLAIKLRENPEQHRVDLTPWSEQNTEAFQGLHAKGRLVMVMMDEGSAIPKGIWEVVLGAMTDEDTVLLFIVFGNPTQATGEFRECFRKRRNDWHTWNIDSRTVEGTNKKALQSIVDRYGEDHDVSKVRVRGLFPNLSDRQMVPEHLIDEAMGRHLRDDQFKFAPTILTCDPAWTGEDELVIAMRQGLMFKILEVVPRNDDDILIGRKLANYEITHNADAVFIDLGHGTGIYSYGKAIGREWRLIGFGSGASRPGFVNKRAEMYDEVVEWLRAGGALPDDPKLREDLMGVQTKPRPDGQILLMSKEDMKKDGLPSPDRADALALSFAEPVMKRTVPISQQESRRGPEVRGKAYTEYDPFRD